MIMISSITGSFSTPSFHVNHQGFMLCLERNINCSSIVPPKKSLRSFTREPFVPPSFLNIESSLRIFLHIPFLLSSLFSLLTSSLLPGYLITLLPISLLPALHSLIPCSSPLTHPQSSSTLG